MHTIIGYSGLGYGFGQVQSDPQLIRLICSRE